MPRNMTTASTYTHHHLTHYTNNTYPWKPTRFIQQRQNAHLVFNQIQHILIVLKCNVAPVNLLLHILLLLLLEYMSIEMLLELFICQVDAKLLKVVLLKALKTYKMVG